MFMKLCMVCAYPSTPVLNGVWRTCGLIQGGWTSVQIPAIQRHEFCVDKNLYGVSWQVTAPGVLPFGQIFAALRGGNDPHRNAPPKLFARAHVRDQPHPGFVGYVQRN